MAKKDTSRFNFHANFHYYPGNHQSSLFSSSINLFIFFSVYFFSLYFWALNCNLFEFFSITRAVFLFGRVSVMLVITIYCALIGIRREVLLHDNMAFGINKLKWDQIDVDLKISKSHIERTPLIRYVCKYFATLSSLSHPTDGFS